ncbi:hypothetical protein [Actinomadura sp. HBU206391]|uniref:hypothetical protein n=1 Tax=Actinomadura sp. HBU206391 TaxID=2731692 RepID=UPI0016509E2B|nr:hypothetical protein [Actinomadura sp. HBU206391]MBC6458402.1 hypothetical protein [Actinomadura sp. HBU206391]
MRATRESFGDLYEVYYAVQGGYVRHIRHRGGAFRYYSEAEAYQMGLELKRAHRWVSFTVEFVPADARAANLAGTGGRA